MSRLLALTLVTALAVFCVVQDRVTAAGATRYGEEALAAIARQEPVPPVDAVMRPAIGRSLWLGLASAAPVVLVGLGAAAAVSRTHARRPDGRRGGRG